MLKVIEDDPRLRQLFQRFADLPKGDRAHDLPHCLRVAAWALQVAAPGVDEAELISSALLHDVIPISKSDPLRLKASEMAADAARPLLSDCGFSKDATTRIVDAIRVHSFTITKPALTNRRLSTYQ